MRWNQLQSIKLFTPVKDLKTTLNMEKVDDRPLYYLGNGFFLSYTERRFEIKNNERLEYGEEGEFAQNIYYFLYDNEIVQYFKMPVSFIGDSNKQPREEFFIIDKISIGTSLNKVISELGLHVNFIPGETRIFKNGKFYFQNYYIQYGNYDFYFFNHSKVKSKLTGFLFTLYA